MIYNHVEIFSPFADNGNENGNCKGNCFHNVAGNANGNANTNQNGELWALKLSKGIPLIIPRKLWHSSSFTQEPWLKHVSLQKYKILDQPHLQ